MTGGMTAVRHPRHGSADPCAEAPGQRGADACPDDERAVAGPIPAASTVAPTAERPFVDKAPVRATRPPVVHPPVTPLALPGR